MSFWADPTNTGRPAFFVPQSVLRDPVQAKAEWL